MYSTSGMVFNVFFDGGDRGQWAYSSWQIGHNGFWVARNRVPTAAFYSKIEKDIHADPSSNVAEYCSLIMALQWLRSVKEKHRYTVHIFGDSQLVLRQLVGGFRCRKEHLLRLRNDCLELLREWSDWTAEKVPRAQIYQRFGH